jgi:hypothetical protein
MPHRDDQAPQYEYREIRGHFGEAQGDAGQLKTGIAPVRPNFETEAEKLTKELVSQCIPIEVRAVKHLSTGTVVSLCGTKANYYLAKSYLREIKPKWKIQHHIPPQG